MTFSSPRYLPPKNIFALQEVLLWESSAEKISLPLTRLSPFCERGLFPANFKFFSLKHVTVRPYKLAELRFAIG
jgi:hypothetical protein